ncbi:MAG: uroporphyrinogen-III C-methyltransferase [Rhodobacteraceae bacterium]|nr:uroporphyrinogen-III C-methyltransferase [Paracoccaceae bacterium]
MKHFPIFLAVEGRRIVISGGGEAAVAKLRLLLKTEAKLTVVAADIDAQILTWAREGRLSVLRRPMEAGDALCAALFYAANDDDAEDARVTKLAQADGALTNWVDNLGASEFITPAIVDRDPVTVAIGTEGAAPVLARRIKADLEERLPRALGTLARVGKAFRSAADALPMGRVRRAFWSEYYENAGPKAFDEHGEEGLKPALDALLSKHLTPNDEPGHVTFVGAGPGDPELLTLKARKALHEADVVIHDRLITPEILELARREATIIDAGKEGFGPSTPQGDIDQMLVEHAASGAHVVRLKSGDATVFGRLDEEIDAVTAHGIGYAIVPGITSASAAVASIGQSLTKRGRNTSVRLITGHDVKGYADQDWRALAAPGEVAAIYMGKRAARFIQGRLLMHGADPATPVTLIENASRADQRVEATTLGELEPTMSTAGFSGPVLTLFGLAPRAALATLSELQTEEAV